MRFLSTFVKTVRDSPSLQVSFAGVLLCLVGVVLAPFTRQSMWFTGVGLVLTLVALAVSTRRYRRERRELDAQMDELIAKFYRDQS